MAAFPETNLSVIIKGNIIYSPFRGLFTNGASLQHERHKARLFAYYIKDKYGTSIFTTVSLTRNCLNFRRFSFVCGARFVFVDFQRVYLHP